MNHIKLFENFNSESKFDLVKDVFGDLDLEHDIDVQCTEQSTIYISEVKEIIFVFTENLD